MAFLVWSYAVAARAEPGTHVHFLLFWLGVFAFLGPVGWRLVGTSAGRRERLLLVAALGAYSYAPKFLSYRSTLTYFDEIGHLAQTLRLADDGLLFVKNSQIVIISDYPGLHSLAVSMHHMTGLSVVVIAHLLLIALHVTALLGVAELARLITHSSHAGGIAALVYSVGPGFWFFSSQFAYESYALVLLIWGLVATFNAVEADNSHRDAWLGILLVIWVALVTTHHLTSFANIGLLACLVLAGAVLRLRGRIATPTLGRVSGIALLAVVVTAWWFLTQAPNTRGYISPYVADGVNDVISFAKGAKQDAAEAGPSTSRSLFSGSTLPDYEIILGLVTPILLFVAAAAAVIALRRVLLNSLGLLTMGLFTCAYFLALPLVFSRSGAEMAHRSWSFTSLGLSIVIAAGVAASRPNGRRVRTFAKFGFLAVVAVAMIGNTATGMNEVYRFPGPYRYGSDTRSATAEVKGIAKWFHDQYGDNQLVIGERTTMLFFGSIAQTRWALPNESNREWDLVIAERPIDDEVLGAALDDGIRWIIIDRRQVIVTPLIGFYVDQREPLANARLLPLGPGSLTKFNDVPWLVKVMSSTHFDVYRIVTPADRT